MNRLPKTVKGRKSKGGAGGTPPRQDANTLRSRSYARVLDLLGHGEWEGLVNGARSIFLDETPLVSIVDSQEVSNFEGLSWTFLPGTQTQSFIPGFDSVEAVTTVGVLVRTVTPVIRTITNSQADKVILNIRIPRLYQQTTAGDVLRTGLDVKVYCALNGGSYDLIREWSWYDKCVSDYLESMEFILPRSVTPDTDTWSIKIERITPDHDDSATIADQIYWESYSEVVTQKLSYPNMALSGVEVDAVNFSKIPNRAWEVKMKKISVPMNYDPVARTYATSGPGTSNGGWDGTFKTVWSNNPAWVFYDLVSNKFYGLGKYINPNFLDKWTLYEIATYCDVLVPDGNGGTEPRFVCNVYLQSQQEALKVLSDFASIFRGMIYYFNGRIVPVQDRPRSPVMTFTKANVKDGLFNYTSTGRRARKTVAMVRFLDPSDFYRPAWQPVEDYEGIARYGYQEIEVVAFGTTSRGQAYRYGRHILETEKLEGEGISFRTGQDACLLRIGDIIQVQDADRAQAQLGGRVLAGCTASSIILDRPVLMEAGKTYTLTLVLPKAVTDVQDVTDSTQTASMRTAQIEAQGVTLVLGNQTTLSIPTPFTSAPAAGSIWVLTTSSVQPQKFRILSVKEIGKAEWEVSGNVYAATKFDNTEIDPNWSPTPIIRFPVDSLVSPISDIVAKLRHVVRPDGVHQFIDVSWMNNDPYANRYRLTYVHDGGNLQTIPETSVPYASFEVSSAGSYVLNVIAVRSASNATSIPTSVQLVVPNTLPLDQYRVTGLELKDKGNIATFEGKDAAFVWRLNSPSHVREMGAEEFGSLGGEIDPYFAHYKFVVWADGVKVFEDITLTPNYTYTFEKNKEAAGPNRLFTVYVYPVDKYNGVGIPAVLTVNNPAPVVPDVILVPLVGSVNFKFAFPSDADFRGYRIWISDTPGFTPSDGNLAYDGPDSMPTVRVIQGVTYYARYAAYDAFGVDELNYSDEIPVVSYIVFDNVPPAVPTMLALASYRVLGADNTEIVRIRATWNANIEEDFAGYILMYRQTLGYDWISVTLTSRTNVTFELDALANTSYDFKIAAFDRDFNTSAYSSPVNIVSAVDSVPPAAPTWAAGSASFRNLFLSWVKATETDFSYYEVWQNTVNNSATAAKVADLLKGTSLVLNSALTGVLPGTTLYFWLKAVDTSLNASAFSAVQSVTIGALAAPTGLASTSAAVIDSDGAQNVYLDITWNATAYPEFKNYTLEVSRVSGLADAASVVISTQATAHARVKVEGNTAYFVRIRVEDNNNGFSNWSSEINPTSATDTTAPGSVTSLAVRAGIRFNALTMTLPADKDLAYLRIFRNTTNSKPGSFTYRVQATSAFIDDGVVQGVTYYYWVETEDTSLNVNTGGSSVNGVPGQASNADIADLAVDKLTAGSITAKSITLASATIHTVIKSSNWNGSVDANNAVTAAGTAGFFINSQGYGEFNNVRIRGDIVAGTITIGSSAFQVDATGRMWMGHATFGSAPFSVTAAGVLVASGATISGAVQARTLEAAQTIILGSSAGNKATSIIQAYDYSAGTTGWKIDGDGVAEFNEIIVRNSVIVGGTTGATNFVRLANVSPTGAGLFIGQDYMGYYNSGWKTYMDNSGNFYLGGTSGSLQWNGTTLIISGRLDVGTAIERTIIDSTTFTRGNPTGNRVELYSNTGSAYSAFRAYNSSGAMVGIFGTEISNGYGMIRLHTAAGVEKLFLDGTDGTIVLSNVIRGPFNSAASPTYTFAGRTDDGVYSAADGSLGIGLNGKAALTILESSNSFSMEFGAGRTGDGTCFIDLIGKSGDDYGLRLLRNGGTNATSSIVHLGTGQFAVSTVTAGASILLSIASGCQVTLDSDFSVSTAAQIGGQLDVTGEIRATGDVVAFYSDRRLKQDFEPITNAVAKVMQLNGCYFNPNKALLSSLGQQVREGRQVGLIAQDVEAVLGEAVRLAPFDTDSRGGSLSGQNYLTLQYERVVPLLIEAIKEQQNQIATLKKELYAFTQLRPNQA